MTLAAFIVAPFGCAKNDAFKRAFDAQSSLVNNTCSFPQQPDSLFVAVKEVFAKQGFVIKAADQKSGIISAAKNMADPKDEEISYAITATANITEIGDETNVSLAMSQQTVVHKKDRIWWHLLWIVPLFPIGTEYQTAVVNEGDVTDPKTYTDFFAACKIAATKYDLAIKAAALKALEKATKEKEAKEKRAQQKKEAEEAKAAAEKVAAENAAEEAAIAQKLSEKAPTENAVATINNDTVDKVAADKTPAEATETKSVTN